LRFAAFVVNCDLQPKYDVQASDRPILNAGIEAF